ncbi:ferritin-like domain-containing protein [Gorillibacterium massiliense]|uniref:ferritin-like domain-containing protein n=1 Tax=Gorillibacterium massiliense TaxID=1280390 RepID=UPI0004B36443|nr:ferritin-like domain-containing protein [Gorillibacterium massiliense]
MEENSTVIKELNAFLKGQYMGIHAYENYIQKTEDEALKKEFQDIQQDHKLHAALVAERIQNLGGRPVDDEGLAGSIQEWFSRAMVPREDQDRIEGAAEGEDKYGIHLSEEIVKGDLDEESMRMIQDILDTNRRHVEKLKKLLHLGGK